MELNNKRILGQFCKRAELWGIFWLFGFIDFKRHTEKMSDWAENIEIGKLNFRGKSCHLSLMSHKKSELDRTVRFLQPTTFAMGRKFLN